MSTHTETMRGLIERVEHPVEKLLAALVEMNGEGLATHKRGLLFFLEMLELYQEYLEGAERLAYSLLALEELEQAMVHLERAESTLLLLQKSLM